MPITITLLPSNEDGSGSNLFYAIGTLTFSGNYPTGGDTMDFTTVADKLPSTQIIQVFADSQNGNSGYYVPVQGSPEQLEAQSLHRRRHRGFSRRVPGQRHHRHRPSHHHRTQAAVMPLSNHVQDTFVEELFGVWLAASSEPTVL